jgi:hypothetical protein
VRVIGQAGQEDVAERRMHQFREAGIGLGLGLSLDVLLKFGGLCRVRLGVVGLGVRLRRSLGLRLGLGLCIRLRRSLGFRPGAASASGWGPALASSDLASG